MIGCCDCLFLQNNPSLRNHFIPTGSLDVYFMKSSINDTFNMTDVPIRVIINNLYLIPYCNVPKTQP